MYIKITTTTRYKNSNLIINKTSLPYIETNKTLNKIFNFNCNKKKMKKKSN